MPAQDKQYLVGFAQLPDGATLDRTEEVIRKMGDIALKQPGVESAVAFPGLSINGFTNSSNAGIVFVDLEAVRRAQERRRCRPAPSRGTLNQKYAGDPGRVHRDVPAAAGAGPRHHRRLQAADRGSRPARLRRRWTTRRKAFMAKALRRRRSSPACSRAIQVNVPQLYADIDRTKAQQLGVPVTDVFDTMQIYLGSLYVNDFNRSAAPIRCACRRTRRSARAPRTSAS